MLMKEKSNQSWRILRSRDCQVVNDLREQLASVEKKLKAYYDWARKKEEDKILPSFLYDPNLFYYDAKELATCKTEIGPLKN